MLTTLSIRDVVLIERLELDCRSGLSVLTGETGAGKSILLDALGLAIGARSDASLVRQGVGQASVSASFDLRNPEPFDAVMEEAGLDPTEGALVLRRVVTADGRSRAFANDQPISVGLQRRLGDLLVEIQGQFDQHGLLNPANHRSILDAFGGLGELGSRTSDCWRLWSEARAVYDEAAASLAKAKDEDEWLRHSVEELDQLSPKSGEATSIEERRVVLANAETVLNSLNLALNAIDDEQAGADAAISRAQRELDRASSKAGGKLTPLLEALDRAQAELREAVGEIPFLAETIEADSGHLSMLEDRLHEIRSVARKHNVEPDELAGLHEQLAQRLASLDNQGGNLKALADAADHARALYVETAKALSTARREAAARLDKAVMAELVPLKLERALVQTEIAELEESRWGANGLDAVSFRIAANPGMPPGPLAKVASGGELSRFLLALKVVLAEANPIPTLVFDEVDAGVGGAVAAAVGERLSQLARKLQVLVVTHSPQVAAKGVNHWHISKQATETVTATSVTTLSKSERREEIARMLSGSTITDEARAAADSLLRV